MNTLYRFWKRIFCLLLLLLVVSILLMPAVYAHIGTTAKSNATSTGRVTIIVIDMSGSMATNDPNGVRCSAAYAYIDLSGQNDLIGVISLDGNQASTWSQPTSVATQQQRSDLKSLIATKSNNCAPDASTPTYDALDKARQLLSQATQGGRPGSVILLTDGDPEPDPQGQEQNINGQLVPVFHDHKWPIDSIALGTDTNFAFLHSISDATGGLFYQDTHGPVAGDSPLNIASFFVDIFRIRSGLTVGTSVDATPVQNGTPIARDFQVGDYIDNLAIIALKDDPNATITLVDPRQHPITISTVGALVTTDPHYAIYSIDRPEKGTWTLTVTGSSGYFLMNSLIKSSLQVNMLYPTTGQQVLPLGQAFTLQAQVTAAGNPTGKNAFSLNATITSQDNVISQGPMIWNDADAAYTFTTSIANSRSPGSYTITVSASSGSGIPISQANAVVQLDHFPVPLFFAPGTHVVVQGQGQEPAVTTTVVKWDPVLNWLYSHIIPQIGQLALQGIPTDAAVELDGQVQLQGKAFAGALVTADILPAGAKIPIQATVKNDSDGIIHLLLPHLPGGVYTVRFSTTGSYRGNHDFGTTQQTIRLSITSTTPQQEAVAWGFTVFYLFLLLLLVLVGKCLITSEPDGTYRLEQVAAGGNFVQPHRFKKQRSPLGFLLHRNYLPSQTAMTGAGKGLELHVNYDRQGSVRVRTRKGSGKNWSDKRGRPLSSSFTKVEGVVYKSGAANKLYTFVTKPPDKKKPAPTRSKRGGGKPGSNRYKPSSRQAPRRMR